MKRGVTLIILIITVLVMTILAGVIVVNGTSAYNSLNFATFGTEILNIQNNVDEYVYKNFYYPTLNETIEFDISKVDSENRYQFEQEEIVNNKITLNKINFYEIGIEETLYGNNKSTYDMYVISQTTGKVYYLEGMVSDNKKYYTVDDELYNVLDVNITEYLKPNEVKMYDIIFEVSTLKYTSEPITVKVKLPKSATINSITTTNSKSVSSEVEQGSRQIVEINTTTLDKTGNYDVTVNYTYNGIIKEAIYKVKNFDNVAPQVTTNISIKDGIKTIDLNITEANELKTFKYDTGLSGKTDTELKEYFKYYGEMITNNKILISEDLACYIYIEDVAGNHIIITSM